MNRYHFDNKPSLIPFPKNVEWREDFFQLGPDSVIVVDEALQSLAELLASYFRPSSGYKLPISDPGGEIPEGATALRIQRSEPTTEAGKGWYRLTVKSSFVLLEAEGWEGFNHAVQTLRQLFPSAIYDAHPRLNIEWMAPCVLIEDWPNFEWRGVMLDSVRHFQPLEWVFRWIDLLAQHKFNVFHWHLTDDQGWRIEIKKYPKLVEIASHRKCTMIGHSDAPRPCPDDGTPYSGYYTQEECRRVVEYAAARGITVVPEIDMPGHATAALAAYPELGVTNVDCDVATTWGIHTRLFNMKEETLKFIDDILEEILTVFPSDYIHLGGDEAVKDEWNVDPDTQQQIKDLGLKDSVELQAWFFRRMERFLSDRGRRLIGWDEILDGGIKPSTTVIAWRGDARAIAAAKAGHDVVCAPKKAGYLDYYQNEDISTEPLAIGGCVRLEDIYDFNPVPGDLSKEETARVIGVQAQMWSEYLSSTGRVEYMAFPRLCAFAEMAWRKERKVTFEVFKTHLKRHLSRLDVQDVRYRSLG